MAKKSKDGGQRKMAKNQRSAVKEKWPKIKGPLSEKNEKKSKFGG